MNQIIALLLVAAGAATQGTIVEPCGGTARLNLVDVEGCVDSVNGRCQFVKGHSCKITVDATPTATDTALPYTAKARILRIYVTLLKKNACESLTVGNCPVENGERIVLENKITITKNYPALTVPSSPTSTREIQSYTYDKGTQATVNHKIIFSGTSI